MASARLRPALRIRGKAPKSARRFTLPGARARGRRCKSPHRCSPARPRPRWRSAPAPPRPWSHPPRSAVAERPPQRYAPSVLPGGLRCRRLTEHADMPLAEVLSLRPCGSLDTALQHGGLRRRSGAAPIPPTARAQTPAPLREIWLERYWAWVRVHGGFRVYHSARWPRGLAESALNSLILSEPMLPLPTVQLPRRRLLRFRHARQRHERGRTAVSFPSSRRRQIVVCYTNNLLEPVLP
jgi:hypothetical protein